MIPVIGVRAALGTAATPPGRPSRHLPANPSPGDATPCHDVFNGDADGLCALHQLRLAAPRHCHLVTAPKRDVRLLARIDAREGDSVTVLDISLDVNRTALDVLLARGVDVAWFDHRCAGDVPVHPGLSATIDSAPDVCTAMLVDRHLGGRYRAWAVAAAEPVIRTLREGARGADPRRA